MGFVSLISFLENDFHIATLDEDIMEENFESIDAITKYVKSKID
jgi:acyl carrier protein